MTHIIEDHKLQEMLAAAKEEGRREALGDMEPDYPESEPSDRDLRIAEAVRDAVRDAVMDVPTFEYGECDSQGEYDACMAINLPAIIASVGGKPAEPVSDEEILSAWTAEQSVTRMANKHTRSLHE